MTDVDLSILLTDDAGIRELNRTWRGQDRATDVLSFSQVEGEGPAAGPMLGDVVVSTERAAAQASRAGHDLGAEIDRLLVHGILHLIGHDHVHGGAPARRMKAEERRLLALLAPAPAAPPRRQSRSPGRKRAPLATRGARRRRARECGGTARH